MRDRVARWCVAIAGILHLAFANRYDLFRDELYFIVCGRHPAFGYADQPPLVPLLAAAGYAFEEQTWIVRIPDVLAAMALAWLAVAFVRLLGGRNIAAAVAGLAVTLAPMLAGITATLNTTSFEPLAWTAIAYLLARFALLDDRRAPLLAGAVAGTALEAKYALPLWLAALAIGLSLTSQRRMLARYEVWTGIGIAAAVAAPSMLWQTAHGWPFVELVRNARYKDVAVAPAGFFVNQVFVFGPLLAPFWIAGIVAPFLIERLRAVRFVSIAYALTAGVIIATHGKDYYLAATVPPLFVFGSIALESVVRPARLRAGLAAVALASTLPILPFALPILPPDRIVAYERAIHMAPQNQEHGDDAAAIPPLFGDMLGWHDFVRETAAVYAQIPAAQRARTAIVVDNYGEAAAIDLYGARYGLPAAASGHNQYYLWGPPPDSRSANVLRVQDDIDALRPYCRAVPFSVASHSPYARAFENDKIIAYCAGLHPALSKIWPSLKRYI